VQQDTVASDSLNQDQQADPKTQPQDEEGTPEDEQGQTELRALAVKSNYIWPVTNGNTKILRKFKEDDSDGIVIDASVGTPVKAVADGEVLISGTPSGDAAAYGITIVLKHASLKTMTIYANLKETSVAIHQKVKQGAVIGKTGKSGTIADRPQLYFEISDLAGKSRRAVDPEKLLPQ
jgi:murein DD-endopeptidase MepM/ murein hydrolase activator NlpD